MGQEAAELAAVEEPATGQKAADLAAVEATKGSCGSGSGSDR